MKNKTNLRFSQTMIVKNEEKDIKTALSWGKELMSEQVVVDTGSTDRTVEIAESMGAKVIHFDWIDDFAAAKNYALDNCHCDWIFILDADEYFSKEDADKLPSIIDAADKAGFCAVQTGLISVDGKGGIIDKSSHIRIIKNTKELRYKRRIHEVIVFKPEQKVYDATDEVTIIHTGYIEEVIKDKGKKNRNLSMLLKELETNPEDPEILGYLADEYATDNRQKALPIYRKAISYLPKKIDIRDWRTATTFTKFIVLLSLENLSSEIIEVCDLAEKKMPHVADFPYYAGLYFYNRKEYDSALPYYERALQKYDKKNSSEFLSTKILLAYSQYGHILLETNALQGAVAIESNVLKADKKEFLALTVLLKAFNHSGVPAQKVVDHLSKTYDLSQSIDKILIYKASFESGFSDLNSLIFDMMDEKEKAVIKKIVV